MIDVNHVSFQYTGAEGENLKDFNLTIKKGECVVLTGESGCGKTCVTRLINTLIPHFYEGEMSGTVAVDGIDTRTIQPHDLSDKIGSVFQNPRSQFFSLDTDSEIVFGMENRGLPYPVMQKRYQKTIQELRIEKLKGRNLFDLSGGQKQTIAFASVYALDPDIFVLDEPSSNLDPEAIQELRRLLLLIKKQGKTIVVSEHRLYFLNGIADRIVLMEKGRLKQSWSASDFALLSDEQIKGLGLRSYTPARLELPETMPAGNAAPAVEVKDLAIGYEKGKPVAQRLNFRVYPGEIVGVVGKNGCGKSTLARTLCGLQKELGGEILYKNSRVPVKLRIRKAYLVMQDPDYQLFTDSVYEELRLALFDQKNKAEGLIDMILDALNLTIYKNRHPMSLSGGQKQRTAIGVAALRDAKVLIFDEPTSGLDYRNMERVAEILRALAKKGKAILVISHDNELLMKICSRVICVKETASS
ncbi:MAG: energy-coupling factor ABC transporter ATP-binding protein [Eubacterium sp.]|nr:energy-coupling factor ABC transporter ATP-binding protein [Eubacterium sp.]